MPDDDDDDCECGPIGPFFTLITSALWKYRAVAGSIGFLILAFFLSRKCNRGKTVSVCPP